MLLLCGQTWDNVIRHPNSICRRLFLIQVTQAAHFVTALKSMCVPYFTTRYAFSLTKTHYESQPLRQKLILNLLCMDISSQYGERKMTSDKNKPSVETVGISFLMMLWEITEVGSVKGESQELA